jgi:hypothetical protein
MWILTIIGFILILVGLVGSAAPGRMGGIYRIHAGRAL